MGLPSREETLTGTRPSQIRTVSLRPVRNKESTPPVEEQVLEPRKQFSVALAGNPNTGKSTLFNSLTRSRQHVGNWPGKTIERKHGYLLHAGWEIELVDLPGTFSLSYRRL